MFNDLSQLQLLFNGNIDFVRQGLSLFESLPNNIQTLILKHYPIDDNTKPEILGNLTFRGQSIVHDQIDNHLLNLPIVLHALADSPKVHSITNMVLWLNNSINSELLELLLHYHSVTTLEIRIPFENGQYDSIQANELLSELRNIDESMTLTSRFLHLLQGGSFFRKVKSLTLLGSLEESKPLMSEALLKGSNDHQYIKWGNWYQDERAYFVLDNQFPSLEKLHIQDDVLFHSIDIKHPLTELRIDNTPELHIINTVETIQKVHLSKVHRLVECNFNTSKMQELLLEESMMQGLLPKMHLHSNKEIQHTIQHYIQNRIVVRGSLLYGFGFKPQWEHFEGARDINFGSLDLRYSYFSLQYLIECIKLHIQTLSHQEDTPSNEQDIIESDADISNEDMHSESPAPASTISVARYKIHYYYFDFDEDDHKEHGYDVDLDQFAHWKSKDMNSEPSIMTYLAQHNHEDADYYEEIVELIDNISDWFWSRAICETVLSLIPPTDVAEIQKLLHQKKITAHSL